MRICSYDPDQRAAEKVESRRLDEDALRSGAVTREELQRVNGGYGMFRRSTLARRPLKESGRPDPDAPVDES